MEKYWLNYIGGQFVEGNAGFLPVHNPATNAVLATQALADEKDVDKAVQAAKACHLSGVWSGLRPVERARKLTGIGVYLLAHKQEIAEVLSLESGKPLWEAHLEVEGAARYFEYYGPQAETLEGRSIPLGRDYFNFTHYEPYGVCAQIIPWNYPLEMTARSLSAALAGGNACVVKSPELDPLTQYYFAKACEHVQLPAGLVNIICGHGAQAGAALSAHEDVNQIVFTGSVSTGQAIARAAAGNIVPCILELGGKSAGIVYEDANIEALIDNVRWGIFFNSGQVCSAMSRLIVHEKIYDKVVEGVTALAESLSVGAGIERQQFGANMGALVCKHQQKNVEKMCEKARQQGGKFTTGGLPIAGEGCFFAPSIVKATPDMDIARQEVFGPVLSVLSFRDEKQALDIANGTDYGLVSGVFTADMDRAMRAARALRAGQVFVNEWYAGGVETPFGGYGRSGYGREKGREALYNYVQTKNIAVRIGSE